MSVGRDRLDLHRFGRVGWELWLVPALAAALWATLIARAGTALPLARSVVFVGGPLVLLAGLHERLGAYLHAPERLTLLPRPIAPRDHFAAASTPHRIGLAASAGLGTVGLALGAAASGLDMPAAVGLLVDWLWLAGLAILVEPAVAGGAAWLGRRVPEDSRAFAIQKMLAGGWTLPETAVHLYAPAMGIGVCALLAMPGQLTVDLTVDAMREATAGSLAAALPQAPALWVASLAPLPIALGLRVIALRWYAGGVFQAVPWLHQAVRSLSGPPVPAPAPGWLRWVPDPMLRLWTLQLLRVTPVPMLRLVLLVGGSAWLGLAGRSPLVAVPIWAALVALWLVPAVRLSALAPGRVAFAGSRPLAESARRGRPRGAPLVLALPAVAALALLLLPPMLGLSTTATGAP